MQKLPVATAACERAYTEEGRDIIRQAGSGKSPKPHGVFWAHKLFAASVLLVKWATFQQPNCSLLIDMMLFMWSMKLVTLSQFAYLSDLSNDKMARWYNLPIISALPAQHNQACSRHRQSCFFYVQVCLSMFHLSRVTCRMSRHTDLGSVYLDLVELYSKHPHRAVYYLDLDDLDGVGDDQHVLVGGFKMCWQQAHI